MAELPVLAQLLILSLASVSPRLGQRPRLLITPQRTEVRWQVVTMLARREH